MPFPPLTGSVPTPDKTPPSAPGAPVVTNALANQTATVTVAASTDNVAVAGYAAFLDGSPVEAARSATTAINLTGVPAGSHSVVVKAFDAAGNYSVGSPATGFVIPKPIAKAIIKANTGISFPIYNISKTAISASAWSALENRAAPADFCGIRIGLLNIDVNNAVPGVKLAVAATDTAIYGNNQFAPTVLGVRDDAQWIQATFAGATSVTLPVASAGTDINYPYPSISWSDWINVKSIPRVDGITGLPLLLTCVEFPANAANPEIGIRAAGSTNGNIYDVNYELALAGQVRRNGLVVGSFVTTPSGISAGQNVLGSSYALIIEYRFKSLVKSLAVYGDSTIAEYGYTNGQYLTSWAQRACHSKRAGCANFSGSGMSSSWYKALFDKCFNSSGFKPSQVMYQVFTVNDVTAYNPTKANVDIAISRALDVINTCQNFGIPVILIAAMPFRLAELTLSQQFILQAVFDFCNDMASNSYNNVSHLDVSSLHLTRGQWVAAYDIGDHLHPNQLAKDSILQPALEELLA